ncbi:MAG: hypothetical protein GXX79_01915 [Actinomycetales bacterium]|nr:hypothetical protein [Actinomycetales bacterium]
MDPHPDRPTEPNDPYTPEVDAGSARLRAEHMMDARLGWPTWPEDPYAPDLLAHRLRALRANRRGVRTATRMLGWLALAVLVFSLGVTVIELTTG